MRCFSLRAARQVGVYVFLVKVSRPYLDHNRRHRVNEVRLVVAPVKATCRIGALVPEREAPQRVSRGRVKSDSAHTYIAL